MAIPVIENGYKTDTQRRGITVVTEEEGRKTITVKGQMLWEYHTHIFCCMALNCEGNLLLVDIYIDYCLGCCY